MENKEFFEWYKTKITDNAQDPPDDAWQNIADELDTNDVWGRVATELDHRGGWFGQKGWHYALPALLLLLIPAGLYFYYNTTTDKAMPSTTVSAYAEGNVVAENDAVTRRDGDVDSVGSVRGSGFQVPGSGFQVPDSGYQVPGAGYQVPGSRFKVQGSKFEAQGSELGTEHLKVDSSGVEEKIFERDREPLRVDLAVPEVDRKTSSSPEDALSVSTRIAADDPSSRESDSTREKELSREEKQFVTIQPEGYTSFALRRMTVADSMLIVDPLAVTLEPDSFRTPTDLPSIVFSRSLEFGISGSVKNTWLLNSTTFLGLEKHTLTTTLPDFGKDAGVVVRYTFSPKFSAQAEGFFLSDMGQRYNEYRKGKYIERDVDLNYFHGNLLFRYGNNATLLGRLVNGHGIIAGLYYSKLEDASETIDGHTTDIKSLYSLSDYGLVIGYEYHQHLFSNFFFTTGARINYGLKDLRSHAESKTGTGSFDVNFGLRYRLKGN